MPLIKNGNKNNTSTIINPIVIKYLWNASHYNLSTNIILVNYSGMTTVVFTDVTIRILMIHHRLYLHYKA